MTRLHALRHKLGRYALFALLATLLTPIAALAAPVTYDFDSGTAAISGTISGGSGSIFVPNPIVNVGLTGTSVTVDLDTYTLNDLEIVAADFSVDLNPALTGLQSVSVSGATLESLAPSPIFVISSGPSGTIAQFALQSKITGTAQAVTAGGVVLPATPFMSLPGSGSTAGFLTVSGDEITLQLSGVTVASFPQTHTGGPDIELKADFTFVGKARPSSPIPEPSAALVFGLGLTLAGTAIRKR